MPKKLVHILGGGPWQVPTVRHVKALGYRVLVTDMYTDRPAYALADIRAVVDITDRDATLEIASRHRIDGILCDTTDVGVPTAAFVAEKLGLPGIGSINPQDRIKTMQTRLDAAGHIYIVLALLFLQFVVSLCLSGRWEAGPMPEGATDKLLFLLQQFFNSWIMSCVVWAFLASLAMVHLGISWVGARRHV